ncbi:MAG: transglutaminase family protein [Flavobacteriaceae bacterium]
MAFEYTIKYISENFYDTEVYKAVWQFIITPENNDSQELIKMDFIASIDSKVEQSINGFGFQTIRIYVEKPFDCIKFEAHFKVIKQEINPFGFLPTEAIEKDYEIVESLDFKTDYESYLTNTILTRLSKNYLKIYLFDEGKSIMDNLIDLNNWVYNYIHFKTDVTDVKTLLDDIMINRQGVCQDFSHLFIAIARLNKIPTRYVSGYLHQGDGFFGDSQMHAWVEAYTPSVGWVGFDPTNNLLANHNHIKVSHGKDYNDCPPLKGIIYSPGSNETKHSVEVTYEQ